MMNFNDALQVLHVGDKVTREAWDGKVNLVNVAFPDPRIVTVSPGIDATEGQETKPTWVPSHADMVAEDWVVAE